MYILDKKCSVAPLKNWGRAVSSTEMKLEISSVTPTSKYSLTKLRFASCNAHSLPGILWQHNIIRPCEKYKIFFEKERISYQQNALCPQRNGIWSHILSGWQSGFFCFTHSSNVCRKKVRIWNEIRLKIWVKFAFGTYNFVPMFLSN